jgi:hypothetical protein
MPHRTARPVTEIDAPGAVAGLDDRIFFLGILSGDSQVSETESADYLQNFRDVFGRGLTFSSTSMPVQPKNGQIPGSP